MNCSAVQADTEVQLENLSVCHTVQSCFIAGLNHDLIQQSTYYFGSNNCQFCRNVMNVILKESYLMNNTYL